MLLNWNFADEVLNATTSQINRQKSARNLELVTMDQGEARATFYDAAKNEMHVATLTACDCRDFNFAGSGPRKSFKPCMHIYRLAVEAGLMEAKYQKVSQSAPYWMNQAALNGETDELRLLAREETQWGAWAPSIHLARSQKARQFRAYALPPEEKPKAEGGAWAVGGYILTMRECTCADFHERRLPCKHVYAVALASGITLPVTRSEYEKLSAESAPE